MAKHPILTILADIIKEHNIVVKGRDATYGNSAGKDIFGRPTISLDTKEPCFPQIVAHEIGHVALDHVKMHPGDCTNQLFLNCERDAWLYSEQLCKKYTLKFDYEFAQECFDSHVHSAVIRVLMESGQKDRFETPDLNWRYHEKAEAEQKG